MRYIAMALH